MVQSPDSITNTVLPHTHEPRRYTRMTGFDNILLFMRLRSYAPVEHVSGCLRDTTAWVLAAYSARRQNAQQRLNYRSPRHQKHALAQETMHSMHSRHTSDQYSAIQWCKPKPRTAHHPVLGNCESTTKAATYDMYT